MIMVELKKIDLQKNEVTYEDFSTVNYDTFYDKFLQFWDKRIAGETINPFDMERFMKRSSSKNLKQLIDASKTEGFMEASLGKKLDAGWVKIIIIVGIVCFIIILGLIILNKMGILK
jgi:hypothetical protein